MASAWSQGLRPKFAVTIARGVAIVRAAAFKVSEWPSRFRTKIVDTIARLAAIVGAAALNVSAWSHRLRAKIAVPLANSVAIVRAVALSVSAWPHRLRPGIAVIIAVCVAVARAVALSIAAYFDGSLWLPGEAVGLFEHPGILAIVLGDVVVFLLCVYASQMTVSWKAVTHRSPNVGAAILPADRRSKSLWPPRQF